MSAAEERRARRNARPARIGSVVGDVLEGLGIRDRVEKAETALQWDAIVGPHIARVTRPRGIRGGVLFVEVAGAAWMMELNMMRRTLLARLNETRERGRIERIVFVQSDDGSTVGPRPDRNLRGRG